MYTSAVLVAMFGLIPNEPAANVPSWSTDYWASQQEVKKMGKPMAIFVGNGKQGWKGVAATGKLNAKATKLLVEKYLCVYIDISTKAGRELAKQMRINTKVGIIISDSTGGYQAFRHQGDLNDTKLVAYLTQFADPNRTFVRTISNPDHEVQPTQYRPTYTPSAYTPSYRPGRIFSGAFCPT